MVVTDGSQRYGGVLDVSAAIALSRGKPTYSRGHRPPDACGVTLSAAVPLDLPAANDRSEVLKGCVRHGGGTRRCQFGALFVRVARARVLASCAPRCRRPGDAFFATTGSAFAAAAEPCVLGRVASAKTASPFQPPSEAPSALPPSNAAPSVPAASETPPSILAASEAPPPSEAASAPP